MSAVAVTCMSPLAQATAFFLPLTCAVPPIPPPPPPAHCHPFHWMAHINQLASLTTAPVIYSLGKGPRDLLLSESLNAQLEKFGMACVRLTDADGQLLTIEAATAEALSWENLRRPQPHFLAANDPLFGSKDWSYHGSPFGDMQLLTIKSSHPGLPVDLRHPHWLFEVPASKERKVEKKKQQQSNKMNGAKKRKVSDATAGNGSDGTDGSDGGDGSSSTPPPVTPPPPCGPHVRSGEGRKHGVGYLNFSIILGDNYEVPAFEQLETHYRYCTAEEREEIFWKSRQWLTSAMVSSVPMPQSLATTELESHPWSVYHLGKQTELPIILNELLSSDWARAHPRSYIEPPYAGVLTPFLYHAAPMSFFPMHIEEYALPALNWLFSARRSFSHKTEPAEGRRDAVSADDEQQAGTEGGVAWYCCPGQLLRCCVRLCQQLHRRWLPQSRYPGSTLLCRQVVVQSRRSARSRHPCHSLHPASWRHHGDGTRCITLGRQSLCRCEGRYHSIARLLWRWPERERETKRER